MTARINFNLWRFVKSEEGFTEILRGVDIYIENHALWFSMEDDDVIIWVKSEGDGKFILYKLDKDDAFDGEFSKIPDKAKAYLPWKTSDPNYFIDALQYLLGM